MDTFRYQAPDGLDLHVYRWMPRGEARAVVQIAHGMAEHAGRYAPLAEALAAAGLAVFAHDHRGHGRSVARPEDLGHMADVNGWNRAVEDLRGIHQRIRVELPEPPLFLLGHSMGSFMARRFAVHWGAELAGLALSGTGGPAGALELVGREIALWRARAKGRRATSRLLQFMSFGSFNNAFKPNRTEYDWLSRDEAQVDAYIEDPLCGFAVTTGCWADFLAQLVELDTPEALQRVPESLPVYLLSGDRDPVGKQGAGVRAMAEAYRAAGLGSVTVKLYPEARHEILNETNRREVFADLLAWIEGALTAPGSPEGSRA